MYAYRAELLCDDCGERISADLLREGIADDGDSDSFPQSAPEGETDAPNHCASGEDCLRAVDLREYGLREDDELIGAESRYVGMLLAEDLTREGVRYAYDLVTRQDPTAYQRALARYWKSLYPVLADEIDASARRQGIADGKSAGSWVIDGNTSEETARAILRGIDEGDPEVLGSLPSSPLSGEFADGLLPRDVLGWYGLTEDDEEADDVLRTYEDGYSEGVVDEVERTARAMLPTTVTDLARTAAGWFTEATRDDGSRYVKTRDGSPDWVTTLAMHGHDDPASGSLMLPDDWRYRFIRDAVEWLADSTADDLEDGSYEFANSEAERSNPDLIDWLGSNLSRADYCRQAVEDNGAEVGADLWRMIAVGLYEEAREVYLIVLDWLQDRAEGQQ